MFNSSVMGSFLFSSSFVLLPADLFSRSASYHPPSKGLPLLTSPYDAASFSALSLPLCGSVLPHSLIAAVAITLACPFEVEMVLTTNYNHGLEHL